MKFSHSIQFNAVPEWSSQYIAYSNLKKLLYALQREALQRENQQKQADTEAALLIATPFRDPEKTFTAALDSELKKIDAFYHQKEKEVLKEVSKLEVDIQQFKNDLALGTFRSVSFSGRRFSGNADSDDENGLQRLPSPGSATSAPTALPAGSAGSAGSVGSDNSGNAGSASPAPFTGARRSSRASRTSRGSISLWRKPSRSRSPEIWDDEFDLRGDMQITLKKRLTECFVQLSELKSYISLNHTGFSKILKKFDKSLNTNLKERYMPSLEKTYVFAPSTIQKLDNKLQETVAAYADMAGCPDLETARQQLRLHLREYIVWERNTVWRDMLDLERKTQAAAASSDATATELAAPQYLSICGYRILIPRVLTSAKAGKLLVSVIVFSVLLIWPMFADPEQSRCFALLILASLLWATEAVPLFVTSLLLPLLIVVLRVLKSTNGDPLPAPEASRFILGAMWSSVIMLLLGGFTLAAALSKYQIARLASTWVLSKAGTQPRNVLGTVMVVALVASMWVSNVAAPVLCFSIVQPVLRTLPKGSPFAQALVLGIALAANIGGMASPIASPQNIVALENMDPPASWGQWFVVAGPVCGVSVALIWLFLIATLDLRGTALVAIRRVDAPFSGVQWYITGVTVVTILLWCVAHQLEGVFGEMGVIAIVPMVLLFGPGLLTGEDFNNFLWTIIMLAMGGIALGKAVASSGLLATIAGAIQGLVSELPLFGIMLVFGALILVVATFVSHTVAALIILPLVREIGAQLDDPHPRLLVMASALMCSAAMGLPTSGFPNVTAICMADEMGRPYITVGSFITRGVPSSVIAYITIVTIGYFAMRLIDF